MDISNYYIFRTISKDFGLIDIMTEDEKIVLSKICSHSVDIMNGWMPLPSTFLCTVCNFTLYKTRKILKSLKEQGLIVSDRYYDQTEDGNIFCLNGYILTEKGMKTEEYKNEYDKERKIVLESMGFDIGESEVN